MDEGLLSSFVDGDCDSSYRNFLNDDADFMLHQLFNNEVSSSVTSAPWPFVENNTYMTDASENFFPHSGSNYTSSCQLPQHYAFSSRNEQYGIAASDSAPELNNKHLYSEYYVMDGVASPVPCFSNTMPDDGHFIAGLEMGQCHPDIHISATNTPWNLKRNLDVSSYGQQNSTTKFPNKKTRTMRNDRKNETKCQTKNILNASLDGSNVKAITYGKQRPCSSYGSEDDSNASQELHAEASSYGKHPVSHDKSGKKTGRRGKVIEPQSLYARKRRERINERLRTLQNLVPNGTKVDISTMLEEAVTYVKFLQTQIKLLSSDDLWMYAPIAYNGVDVGLDRRLSHNL